MTYQPPPPPGQPPYGPPPGQPPYGGPPPGQPPYGGPPPGGSSPHGGGSGGFNPSSVDIKDWILLGIGVLTLLLSFFDYYVVKFGGEKVAGENAWNFEDLSFIAFFGVLFAVAATAVLALSIFMPTMRLPLAPRLIALGLWAAALLFNLLAIFLHPDFDTGGIDSVDAGHGFPFWLNLLLSLAGTALAFLRAKETGTALPGPLNNINVPNIGGPSGGGQPYGQQPSVGGGGYGPPPQSQQPQGPPPGYGPPPQQQPSAPPQQQQPQGPPPGYGPPPQQQQPPQGPPPGYGPPPQQGPPPGYGPPQGPPPGYGPQQGPPPGYGPPR